MNDLEMNNRYYIQQTTKGTGAKKLMPSLFPDDPEPLYCHFYMIAEFMKEIIEKDDTRNEYEYEVIQTEGA